jgi:hypothetical protein
MRYSFLLPGLLAATFLHAQSPEALNYQGVARDASGNPVVNQQVTPNFIIHQGTPTGTVVYSEDHAAPAPVVVTGDNGVFTAAIGKGFVLSGSFSAIDWSAGPYFLEVAIDITGGLSYVSVGTQELLSVPYALHAKTAETFTGVGEWTTSGNAISNTNTGYVGVGTTSPKFDVHISDGAPSGLSVNSSYGEGLAISDGTQPRIYFETTDATSGSRLMDMRGTAAGLSFNALNDGGTAFTQTNILNVLKSGRVSIGGSSPNAALSIEASGNTINDGLNIKNGSDDWYIYQDAGKGLRFSDDGTDRLVISSAGTLSIDGKMTCEEVEVSLTAFPDYVFEADYPLMSLVEVDHYIDQHGHLPNVPSAEEIEAGGTGLGELNKILMEKVEELTLHLIEKDKQVRLMQESLNRLEQRMDSNTADR